MNDPMYDWQDRSACRNLPVEMFYLPEGSGTADKEIKKLCSTCPVRFHCAVAGLAEDHGHWGGVAPDARKQWRKDLNLSAWAGSVGGHESRYQRYLPWLRRVFDDAQRMGIKSAFVCNSADPDRAKSWLRSLEAV